MLLKRLRSFITVFALLAFIGQSVAAVNVSCSMMDADAKSSGIVQMEGMDHSAQTMQDSFDSSESLVDCCGDGFCTMTNCLWSPALNITSASQVSSLSSSVLNTQHLSLYLGPDQLSLFRPPIHH